VIASVNTLRKIYRYFRSKPQHIVHWGFRISLIGMGLLACGLVGRLLLIVLPKSGTTASNLDALLPYVPTWWIPETWFGFFAAVMILFSGLIMYGAGSRMLLLAK
jgi:hypothetical protein